jgi:Zn ribbon nucleic-acid-binding protein
MYKLNLIAIVSIVAAVSFVVGMTTPSAFAQDNMTMTMDDNMTSMGNMTGGNATMAMDDSLSMSEMSNATSMTGQ